jgi:DNA (cytosine-5)-methyltransferase 1
MAMANPRLTYEDFVAALHIVPDSPDEISVALTIIGRELGENDIQCDEIVCIVKVPLCRSSLIIG